MYHGQPLALSLFLRPEPPLPPSSPSAPSAQLRVGRSVNAIPVAGNAPLRTLSAASSCRCGAGSLAAAVQLMPAPRQHSMHARAAAGRINICL